MMCVFVYEQEMSSWAKRIRQCGGMHVAGVAKAKLGCSLDQVPNVVVKEELTSAQLSSTVEARTPVLANMLQFFLLCVSSNRRWGTCEA